MIIKTRTEKSIEEDKKTKEIAAEEDQRRKKEMVKVWLDTM